MKTQEQLAQARREECRAEVRRYLVERVPLAFEPEAIRRSLNMATALNFTGAEIDAALALLESLEQVRPIVVALGASSSFQATAKGVLAHERGQ